MRFLPVITAIVVAAVMYAVVFERDWLLHTAGVVPADTQATAAPATPATPTAPQTQPDRLVSVIAMTSTASTVDTSVSLRGQTEAARRVDARAEVGGLVTSEPLRRGTFVSAGQDLCQIDPGTRPARLAEAEAKLAEARISDNAASRLAEGGFGSTTAAVAARAQLEAAQAAVELAERDIERLTIVAPFDGLLESDTAELGSLLQLGGLCAEIIQLDPIKIVAYLPETSVDAVRLGAKATARLGSGREVEGTVSFLSRAADTDTRTFRVDIEVPNADLSIRDGQTADIEIAAAGVPAHRIPASALTLDDEGTMGLRLVTGDDMVTFAPVRILRDTPEGVLVTGLPDTARIIVLGQEFVTSGVKVNVTERGSES